MQTQHTPQQGRRVLTAAHKRAMQRGRVRAQREHQKKAIARVRAFEAWLKAGSKMTRGAMREIIELGCPSDADYAVARQAGAVAR